MPNKSVPGWTQVPVTASEITSIHYDRIASDGSSNQLTVAYQIKDNLAAVRQTATLTQVVGTYPVAVATILAAINTAQGT